VHINFGRYALMLAFPFAAVLVLSFSWLIPLNDGIVADESRDALKASFHNVDWPNSIYLMFDPKKVC
jgi:hypothetical protein